MGGSELERNLTASFNKRIAVFKSFDIASWPQWRFSRLQLQRNAQGGINVAKSSDFKFLLSNSAKLHYMSPDI